MLSLNNIGISLWGDAALIKRGGPLCVHASVCVFCVCVCVCACVCVLCMCVYVYMCVGA